MIQPFHILGVIHYTQNTKLIVVNINNEHLIEFLITNAPTSILKNSEYL